MGKLDGKVALNTGGTSGIGFATAKLFVSEGAYVYVTSRRQEKIDHAVKTLGAPCTGVQGNVASLADLDRLVKLIGEKKGILDIVFVNAGAAEFAPVGSVDKSRLQPSWSPSIRPVQIWRCHTSGVAWAGATTRSAGF